MDDIKIRIKFHSVDDLSLGYYMGKALLVQEGHDKNAVCCDVNDAIEFHNIHQCAATNLRPNNWDEGVYCKGYINRTQIQYTAKGSSVADSSGFARQRRVEGYIA